MFARILIVIALLFPVVSFAQPHTVTCEIYVGRPDGSSYCGPIAKLSAADRALVDSRGGIPAGFQPGDTLTSHDPQFVAPHLVALNDGSGSSQPVPALPDASSPAPSAPAPAPTATPADKLPDPAVSPAKALSDLKQAERQGWPVLVFMIGAMLAKLLGRAKKVAWLAWLDKGRTAIVVGAVGALLTAGYNALADGGSLYAALYAGVLASAAYWNPLKAAQA